MSGMIEEAGDLLPLLRNAEITGKIMFSMAAHPALMGEQAPVLTVQQV